MFIVLVLDVSCSSFVTMNSAKIAPFHAFTRLSELKKQKESNLEKIEEK